jgi:sensor c-di-GMP phosphodiesterase-like protein
MARLVHPQQWSTQTDRVLIIQVRWVVNQNQVGLELEERERSIDKFELDVSAIGRNSGHTLALDIIIDFGTL